MIKMNDRKSVLELAAKLLAWHTYNADCISESALDETLRLSAVALREQADLVKKLEGQLKDVRECEVISTQDYLDMEVMRVTDVLTAARESK
jgi:hypothetical protein